MKKTLSILLTALMVLTLASCKKEKIKPEITIENFVATIAENPSQGQVIGTLDYQTKNVSNIRFDLNSYDVPIALNSSGQITISDPTYFDYEKRTYAWTYGTAVVYSSDDESAQATFTITINITDVDENGGGGDTTTVLAIGMDYQGGKIAYILQQGDPGYDANVQHGLIAAPSDQSTSAKWSNTVTVTGATGEALGTGQANTTKIVTDQGAGNYAAKLCAELVLNGYSDWYLPSADELGKLYDNKSAIGGFTDGNYYWSSTEYDTNSAWAQKFDSPSRGTHTKLYEYSVRAVRSF